MSQYLGVGGVSDIIGHKIEGEILFLKLGLFHQYNDRDGELLELRDGLTEGQYVAVIGDTVYYTEERNSGGRDMEHWSFCDTIVSTMPLNATKEPINYITLEE